ncbi:SDR family oxidoreductase [Haloechinothrix salitolerans]|uniref:SDR family oxidoreductase n=1 Tax=Haloechinothrix salitolerans TaxID=926830 RepID=A0ABW2CBA2_9PSEU
MSAEKVALVTGSARGIGRGIALALAETGSVVHLTDRDSRHRKHSELPGTVEDTADEVSARGGTGIPHVLDHTDDEAVAEVFAQIGQQHSGVDLVVANAFDGNALPFAPAPFWQLRIDHWSTMIDAGLRSHLVTARHAAPLLIERTGLLVLTGYALPENGSGHVFYDLAMTGISTLGKSMARDLAEHDVAAVTVSPGFTRTEAILAAFGEAPLPPNSDSVQHVGRVVAALWNDPKAGALSGTTATIAELAQRYQITKSTEALA